MHANALEEAVSLAVGYLAPLVEICGAAVIILGVIRTVVQFIHHRLQLDRACLTSIRFELVQSLIMGLEFQLAADVLKTALSPTWNHILLLAGLIGLRTALSFLMEHEFHTLCKDAEATKEIHSEGEKV